MKLEMKNKYDHHPVNRIIECSCGAKVPTDKYDKHRLEESTKTLIEGFSKAIREATK